MKTHKAFVTLVCTYRRLRAEDEYAFPEGPNPWSGEWHEISRSPVTNTEDGTAHTCAITYEARMPVFAPTRAKSITMLEEWKRQTLYDDTLPDLFALGGWTRADITIDELMVVEAVNVPMVHKISIPWQTLVDPNASFAGNCARPKNRSLRIDLVLETLRDLLVSSSPYEDHASWHGHQARHLLNGGSQSKLPFCWSYSIKPVDNINQIKQRFVHALLASGYDCYDEWRKAENISLDGEHYLKSSIPQERAPYLTDRDIGNLLNLRDIELGFSLNSSHPDARTIHGVGIAVTVSGFHVILSYGYKGSSWSKTLAKTRLNEPVLQTLSRAYEQAAKLVPDMEKRISERNWKESKK